MDGLSVSAQMFLQATLSNLRFEGIKNKIRIQKGWQRLCLLNLNTSEL